MPVTRDLTNPADLTRKRETGPSRSRRPRYVDLLPPCNDACPAGENIQAWLAHAQAGRLREAFETLVGDNPMPAVHGRVCCIMRSRRRSSNPSRRSEADVGDRNNSGDSPSSSRGDSAIF